MLDKKIKEKLMKKSWDEALKDDTNKYQTWHRQRAMSISAIDDLTLLASKLPEDKQVQIFGTQNIEKFILALLYKGENSKSGFSPLQNKKDTFINEDDYRRLQLCMMLLRNCFHYFEEVYNKEDFTIASSLIQPAISQLNNAKSICRGIIDTIELLNIKKEEGRRNSMYLFNLDTINFVKPFELLFLCQVNKLKDRYYYYPSDTRKNNENIITCKLDISPSAAEYLDNYVNNTITSKFENLVPDEAKRGYERIKNLKPIFAKLMIKDDKSILVEYRNSSDIKNFEIQLDIIKLNGNRYVFGKKDLF